MLEVGNEVEIVGLTEEKRKVVVTGVEMFRKRLDKAETGDNIGALLRGVQRTEIERAFGNGAERMLQNKQVDCSIHGLNFNIHNKAHIARAAS